MRTVQAARVEVEECPRHVGAGVVRADPQLGGARQVGGDAVLHVRVEGGVLQERGGITLRDLPLALSSYFAMPTSQRILASVSLRSVLPIIETSAIV